MILVTVGTERYPFDRLLRYVEHAVEKCAPDEEIVYQIGSSHYQPVRGRVERFFPFSRMKQLTQEASVVIAHAGVGSVNLALTFGKKPIVCPRKKSLNEAINDQQARYARFMADNGFVLLAQEAEEMEARLRESRIVDASSLPTPASASERERLVSFLNSLL